MLRIGYALSSEERAPLELVAHARRAEEVGFEFALVSDHFHPWTSTQGQAPFVWSVIGAIAQATDRIRLGTGVTCPIHRIHPVIVAQAAATCARLMKGRFFLGVGTGEALNEHVVGGEWPPPAVRVEMLEEAVGILRMMFDGESHSHRGRYFQVDEARLYTVPETPVPIVMAAAAPRVAEVAGRCADGLISTSPEPETVVRFRHGRKDDRRPAYGQLTVCWAATEREARRIAHHAWPNAGIPGDLKWELPLPEHFEQACSLVTEERVAERVVCGPDPEIHRARLREFADAGYDHVAVHQVGDDQKGFFRFYRDQILPAMR